LRIFETPFHEIDSSYLVDDFVPSRTAIICSTHNGSDSIAETIFAAREQGDVYIMNDASTDDTHIIAQTAGAMVINLKNNAGKAMAIRHCLDINFYHLGSKRISQVYDFVLVVDDDTVLEDNHVPIMEAELDSNPELSAAEGRLNSKWEKENDWNGFIAARAFASWKVQFFLSRIQSLLKARTWINGTLTMYRADILDSVVRDEPLFMTEDTDWLWQIHRDKKGEIKHNSKARAHLQEPQTFKALYKQHLRWNWGMFQVARKHKIGMRMTRPDFMWMIITALAAHYILMPLYLLLTFSFLSGGIITGLAWFIGRYFLTACLGAIIYKRWQHIFLWPFFIAYDLNWRFAIVHGFFKSLKHPTIIDGSWTSPKRYTKEKSNKLDSKLAAV
jgi:biofilm PGA synthesis N-glycosyltransferase PgaC